MPDTRRKHPGVPVQLKLMRRALRLASSFSPWLAGHWVNFLWYRTHRMKVATREQHILDLAQWRTLTAEGTQVQTYTWGSGPGVLLVHGWNGCAAQLTAIAGALVDDGFRVTAFDAPAHGRSPGNRTELPLISAVIQRLQQQLGPFEAAVTHSFGGMCLMHAIHQGMTIRRVACIAPPLDVKTLVEQFAAILQLTPETVEVQKRLLEKRFGEDIWDLFSMTNWVRHLDIPGLIIHDRQDTYVAANNGRRISSAWPGSKLILTSGLGHSRILRSPVTLGHLGDFLASRTRSTGA